MHGEKNIDQYLLFNFYIPLGLSQDISPILAFSSNTGK